MAEPSRVQTLSTDSAAYIAGLIDGEGTVTLSRLHANESRRLVVSIASTEIELLQFVLNQAGAGKITRKRAYSEKHAASFCYSISSRQALALLHQCRPYLKSYKRKRAELAIHEYLAVTPRNGKYTLSKLAKRTDFEQRLLAIRAHIPANSSS